MGRKLSASADSSLFDHMNVFLPAHVLEDFRPDRDAHFPEMRFLEEKHQGAGLADASTDAERDFVLDDRLVIRELEPIELARDLQLLFEGFSVHTDAALHELVAPLGHRIPDQDVPVEAVHGFALF
jgi:hypothetical protein